MMAPTRQVKAQINLKIQPMKRRKKPPIPPLLEDPDLLLRVRFRVVCFVLGGALPDFALFALAEPRDPDG
jgi:hypothetical protein